jgi:tRNA A-37 threonylcarbamoyl transferase component Bud32/tetratricopeptide (TPR) repeat protein
MLRRAAKDATLCLVTPSRALVADAPASCPACGAQLAAGQRHCGSCGEPAAPDPLVGSCIDKRYEVIRRLGQGGMGTVYEVQHVRLKKRFAMKFIRHDLTELTDFGKRFEREALATSKQKHPNCVAVTDFGRTERDELYLVMEYLEGRSLRDLLGKPMPVARALSIARQITLALQHAHRNGILHRDIKADNVMLLEGPDGEWLVKVLDFGLAVPAESDDPEHIADREVVAGTPTYMAPEQFTRRQSDERSDLYAVGVLLWYMLTGRPVFEASTPIALLRRKAAEPAPALDQVAPGVFSVALQRLIEKVLQRQPEQRFASADALLEALTEVQRSPGGGLATAPRNPLLRAARRGMRGLGAAWADWYYGGGAHNRGVWGRARYLVLSRSGRIVLASGLAVLVLLSSSALIARYLARSHVMTAGDPAAPGSAQLLPTASGGLAAVPAVQQVDLERRTALVWLLISKGACREAALDAEALLRDRPNMAPAHRLYGAAQMCRGRFKAALAAYERAIEIDPRYRADSGVIEDVASLIASPRERQQALEFLAKQTGKHGLQPLLDATTHPDRAFRERATELVRQLGAGARVDWVTVLHLDLEQARSCREKARAVRRLSKLDERRALKVLIDARRARVGRRRLKHRCVRRQLDRAIAGLRKRLGQG